MAKQQSQAGERAAVRAARSSGTRLRAAAAVGLFTAIFGLAACGDDDDAADSTGVPAAADTTEAIEATDPATDSSTPESTSAAADGTATSGETAADTEAGGTNTTAAAPDGTAGDGTADAVLAATESTVTGGTTDGSAPDGAAAGAGPTTTGPPCEFVENASYPLERCNTGPAIAVLQQALQAAGFTDIGVDGLFGDETLYAVMAFQEEQGLTVDGLVGAETWAALDPQGVGDDANGNGVVDPNEVDLG